MATSLKEMGQVKAGTGNTAIYTAGAGITGIVNEIWITNTDTVARQFGLALVRGGSGFTAFTSVETVLRNYGSTNAIAAGDTEIIHCNLIIATTGVLSCKSDAANVVVATVSGVEKS